MISLDSQPELADIRAITTLQRRSSPRKEKGGIQVRTLLPEEAARILQVPKGHVYRLIRERKLPAARLGRLVRISEDALREWIRRGGTAPDALPAAPNT